MRRIPGATFALVACAVAIGGCGFKGPLTLPSKSETVVIRDKQAGTTQSTQVPTEDKLPPPDLPRTDSSTRRGD